MRTRKGRERVRTAAPDDAGVAVDGNVVAAAAMNRCGTDAPMRPALLVKTATLLLAQTVAEMRSECVILQVQLEHLSGGCTGERKPHLKASRLHARRLEQLVFRCKVLAQFINREAPHGY